MSPQEFLCRRGKRTLTKLVDLARPMCLPVAQPSTITPIGTVYDQVLSEATEFNSDLIVVGSHRPSMSTYLLGSNAARIVRHAGAGEDIGLVANFPPTPTTVAAPPRRWN